MKWPIFFALTTALCWGLYGPVLGQARAASAGSPWKPYVGIGVAYLVWALMGGIPGMLYRGDSFNFAGKEGLLGLAAGTLGAWGALSLTFAMFAGGPRAAHIVMPIVFGGAVTVTALTTVFITRATTTVNPLLWVGIVGMFVCIVIVAANTPHAAPGHKPATAAPPSADAAAVQHAGDKG